MRLYFHYMRKHKKMNLSNRKTKSKMDSRKKRQRKRKSPFNKNIFEVSERDLSPEAAETNVEEPDAKVLKTRNSDVTESRQNNGKHNLQNEISSTKEKDISGGKCTEKDTNEGENRSISLTDKNESSKVLTDAKELEEDILEDGEVNDNVVEEPPPVIEPCISIKFSDKSIADMYKLSFLKFIESFVELEILDQDDTTVNLSRDVNLDPQEWVVLDNTLCITDVEGPPTKFFEPEEELAKELPITPKVVSPKKKKKKKKQKELFVVDTKPAVDANKNIPTKYCTKFLINNKELKKNEKEEVSKPSLGQICFNCSKEHSLKDCPNPKNFSKITSNRQKFMNKNKSRYHLEEEQKYSHLEPGKLSPDLRKALGLKKYQVPSYIYQMRICGYPPGWLEEAKVVHSDLAMFDIDGNNVKNSSSKRIKGLDPRKVIHYPGFNAPLEKEFRDEYKYYRVPPYSDEFNKDKMIDFFKQQHLREEDNFDTEDMDLDNANDPLNKNVIKENIDVTGIQNKHLEVVIDSHSNAPSPSLKDLENAKATLLAQLNKPEEQIVIEDSSQDAPSCKTEQDSVKNQDSADEINRKESKEVVCKPSPSIIEIKISDSDDSSNAYFESPVPQVDCVNSVKKSTFGTPVLKSNSPYSQLPNPDNFSKDVSPVINFENLPNSTGKYEQMTGVLQKVRDTLKNLHGRKT